MCKVKQSERQLNVVKCMNLMKIWLCIMVFRVNIEPYLPSLKKVWLELFFLRRLRSRSKQSSTTMPPSLPPSSVMISSNLSKAFSKATIFWMLALPLVNCVSSSRPWDERYRFWGLIIVCKSSTVTYSEHSFHSFHSYDFSFICVHNLLPNMFQCVSNLK